MSVIVVKNEKIMSQLGDFSPGVVASEAITVPKSENMCIGYYKMNPGAELKIDDPIPFEEFDYMIEGSATISDETGSKYTAEKGDIFCLRKGSKITITTEGGYEGIYIIYPYNWAELVERAKKK